VSAAASCVKGWYPTPTAAASLKGLVSTALLILFVKFVCNFFQGRWQKQVIMCKKKIHGLFKGSIPGFVWKD
jgi:hypothetical protein